MQSSWNDFFKGTEPTPIREGIELKETLIGTSGDFYIRKVLFQSFVGSNRDGGGAIFCQFRSVNNLLIEETSFDEVKTTGDQGGAIHVQTKSSVLSKVCGYGCTVNRENGGNNLFAFLGANPETGINYLSEVSIVSSVSEHKSQHTVYICFGNSSIKTANISLNKCHQVSALSADTDTEGFIKYCSFDNNTAYERHCVHIQSVTEPYAIDCCNFIGNTESYNNQYGENCAGLIDINGPCLIDTCSILRNKLSEKSNYMVNQHGIYDATLIYCVIDFTEDKVSDKVSITNQPSGEFIIKPYMIDTFKCEAEYTDGVNTIEFDKKVKTAEGKIGRVLLSNFYILIFFVAIIL